MTDPVRGVSGTQGPAAGGSYSGGSMGEHRRKGSPAPQADFVEISKTARDRSSGKSRKSIFEYLKDLLLG